MPPVFLQVMSILKELQTHQQTSLKYPIDLSFLTSKQRGKNESEERDLILMAFVEAVPVFLGFLLVVFF